MLEPQPLGPQNVTVFGDETFKEVTKEGHEGRTGSLGWAQVQYDCVLMRRRQDTEMQRDGHARHGEETPSKRPGERPWGEPPCPHLELGFGLQDRGQ